MKKIALFTIIIAGLTSCKKDRVCTCRDQGGNTISQGTYTNVTRKEAKNLCTSSSQGVTCTIN